MRKETKKILIIVGTILVVVGGVAVMSAYEAHVINVIARIENALLVDTTPIEFGTVFPQEYLERQFTINLSGSFMDEDRVDDVNYFIKQKPKPIWTQTEDCYESAGYVEFEDINEARTYCHDYPEDLTCCYISLCPYLSKLPQEQEKGDIGVPSYYQATSCITPDPDYAVGRLAKSEQDTFDVWTVDLKVPPVQGFVGQDWPAGCPTVDEDSQEYGCDLWIEVTGISEGLHESECSPGAVWSCNTGSPGVCASGTKTCDQSGYWGSCTGPEPTTEICDDSLDNDCDGLADCEDGDCSEYPACQPGPTPECEPGTNESCSSGLPGICALGTRTCDLSGFWEECIDPEPIAEICDDGLDNDCDGLTDCDDNSCAQDAACEPTPVVFEYYNAGGDSWRQIYGSNWAAQTFTPDTTHTINSVKILVNKGGLIGLPGTVTMSIRATSGGNPTGGDLCSGTINGNTLNGSWEEITCGSGYELNAGTKYAIVVRAPSGDTWNWISWKNDSTSPTYSGGNYIVSTNSGSSWSGDTSRDFMFEEWGI